MAIFSSKSVLTESQTGFDHVDYNVQPTMEASDQILYEFAEDMYKAQAGLYISDIIIEQAVSEGAEPEALVEGTVKDFFKRIKDALKKLWDKIVAWFKSIIENLKVMFSSGEKFIKKYEKAINEKKDDKFEYTGFKYDMNALLTIPELPKSLDEVAKQIETNYEDLKDDEFDVDEGKKEVLASTAATCGLSGIDSVDELKKELVSKLRGGDVAKSTFTFSSGNGKGQMIDLVKNHSKILKGINKYYTDFNNAMSKVIKACEKAENKVKEGGNTTVFSKLVTVYKYGISLAQAVCSVRISIQKEAYGACLATLKRFVMWKPAKESFEGETETGSKSILESAISML